MTERRKVLNPLASDCHDLLVSTLQRVVQDLQPSTNVDLTVDYQSEFFRLFEFRKQYFLSELLSKFADSNGVSAKERRTAAINKWLSVESRNAKTNHRILLDSTVFRGTISSDSILDFAAGVIRSVIGSTIPKSLFGGFTNGASTSQPRHPGSAARKLTEQAHATADGLPFILPIILENAAGWSVPYLRENFPETVRGNVLFTVPKNANIDRVACKEPDLNLWCQKACGNYIRSRLKRFGIDLNDQTANQDLSQIGSREGNFATIDLSSASDSLSTSLVCRLLSPDWFVLLDHLRSRETCIDGDWHENQMFSSMGNGFTFELESLIFWALSRSVAYHMGVQGRILVFGDDIIVPTPMASTLVDVLGFCGFLANSKKTFSEGPFRESCGSHWYKGYDVKPMYVKTKISTIVDAIRILNQFRSWLDTHDHLCAEHGFDSNLSSARETWYSLAHRFVDKRVWGGRYLDRVNQLVTPSKASHVVHTETIWLKRDEDTLQAGLYLLSLAGGSPPVSITSLSDRPKREPKLVRDKCHVLRRLSFDYWTSVAPKPSW